MKDNLLSLRKIGFLTKHGMFIFDPNHDLIHALFIVTLRKVLLLTDLILEFKGRVRQNQGILPW